MPKGLKKGQLWGQLSRDPLEARSQIQYMLGTWVWATDRTQIWNQEIQKSPRQAFETRCQKRGVKFQYFGVFGAQTDPYDSKEKGIGIYIQKLTEARRDKYPIRLETRDRLKRRL